MDRQTANLKLVEVLTKLIEKNPDQRFGQLLRNYGFILETDVLSHVLWVNEFNLEPDVLLTRVKDFIYSQEPQVTITNSQFWDMVSEVRKEKHFYANPIAMDDLKAVARKLGLE